MARILLIVPHLPQRMGAPYLGQQYVAATLASAGHQVRCLDVSAIRWTGGDDQAIEEASRFAPDAVGMTLFTFNALRGYQLAARLRDSTRILVAGGPHATVCGQETLAHGFDVCVTGEGEHAMGAIADLLDHAPEATLLSRMTTIAGLLVADGQGPPRQPVADLDGLAFPLESYPSYEARWYGDERLVVPGGMVTSRGCPARCSFCANHVTGRAFRWRSADNVVAEMCALRERHGVMQFSFWDDAFTAHRPRLRDLCDAIDAESSLDGVTWSCITPANMVQPAILERMKQAGCVAINFGIESGDKRVLKSIDKGQRPEQILTAVAAASALGMSTVVNFMFGFPGEDVEALDRTHDLMESLAQDVDYFNNRGVLVPMPGTGIYDLHHARYGFTNWWLDPKMIPDEPNLYSLEPRALQEYVEHDITLDLDFFRYDDAVRDRIAELVRFKARHNERTMQRIAAGNMRAPSDEREALEAGAANATMVVDGTEQMQLGMSI